MVSSPLGFFTPRSKSRQTNDDDCSRHHDSPRRRHSWEDEVPCPTKAAPQAQRANPVTVMLKRQLGDFDRAASGGSASSGGSALSRSGFDRTASGADSTSSGPSRPGSARSAGSETEKKEVMTMERALKAVTDVNSEVQKRLAASAKSQAAQGQKKSTDEAWVEQKRSKLLNIYVVDATERVLFQTLLHRVMSELSKLAEDDAERRMRAANAL